MNSLYILFLVIGILIILFLIFSLPRKKNIRNPSIEGINDSEVAAAFEKMTNFLPFRLLRRRVLIELKKYNPSGKLMDLGCGSGNLIIQIAKHFPNLDLKAVDVSLEVLDLAKARVIEKNMSNNIEFKFGSAEDLPFPDNSFDFVVSTLSLHHWKDPFRALIEIYRILNSNGILLIFDFRRDARKFFYGLLKFATKVVVPKALKKISEPIGSLQAGYTPKEILQITSDLSFNKVDIKPFLAWMFIKLNK
ncbi:MAG: class I SAM-dependent methyltransferase [Candidatus Thorarchaeota archaeon]